MLMIEGMTGENINRFEGYINCINSELNRIYTNSVKNIGEQRNVADAMWYSLSAGGKRIRPVLVMEFCRVCGGNPQDALSAACAIEMIHTFSLIHDDLPCMDDDDFRRGKLSCHKKYGEATALLAGDALENLAFSIIAEDDKLSDKVRINLIKTLSDAVGVNGMIGGQVIDTEYEGKSIDEELLLKMYGMKTGALLKAACEMGCICAGIGYEFTQYAVDYAESLGRAFQIKDDILDIVGTQEQLGKPIGSDAEKGKITFATINGIEKSEKYASELTDKALKLLDIYEDNSFLKELTLYLLKRSN